MKLINLCTERPLKCIFMRKSARPQNNPQPKCVHLFGVTVLVVVVFSVKKYFKFISKYDSKRVLPVTITVYSGIPEFCSLQHITYVYINSSVGLLRDI